MYDIIVNPVAGKGACGKYLPGVKALLDEKGLSYEVHVSSAPRDPAVIAAVAASKGSEGVVCMGGDGTLSEAAMGLSGSSTPLLIVPCGTGNDYIKTLALPKDPISALRYQLGRPARRFDMCTMNDGSFINVAGTGLDVDVLLCTEKYKQRYSGLSAYLRGVFDALRSYRPVTAQIAVDGGAYETVRFSVLSLGIGRYIGGGIKAVPNADPADGLLDLVIVKPVRKIFALPCVFLFVLGLHVKLGLTVTSRRVTSVDIKRAGMTVQTDGELVQCPEAHFAVRKGALALRV